jgi:PAS domain S-box-containing protein
MKENLPLSHLDQILLDNLPCVALLLRPETREIVASNQAAVKVGAVPGTQCFATWGQRDAPCPWCLAPTLWKTGEPQHLEVEADGVHWDAHWIPVAPDLYLHYAFDISDRMRSEEALSKNLGELQKTSQQLEQSRNMLQLIIESIPVRVFWKDRDSRYLGCNTLFARDAGFSHPEELRGKDDFAMAWREQADMYRADDRQVMESGRPKMNIIEPQTISTGAQVWVNTSKVPLKMPDGEVFGVLGVYEDITERKQAEEALLESEQKLGNIIDFLPNATLVIDQAGKVIAWNKAIEEMTGIKAQDMVGRGNYEYALPFYGERRPILIDLVLHPQAEIAEYAEVKHTELTLSGVAHLPNFRGKGTYLFGKASALLDSHGNVVGAIESIRDITLNKRAEVERLRFDKLEAIGTLAGGIAHDFNNILTAIVGNISLAMLDQKMEAQSRERLTEAEKACYQAQNLSRQFLTFAKGGAPIKELISLKNLIAESASLACRGSQVRCEYAFAEDLMAIEGDPGQIIQVVQNLILNAIQAMPNGGIIKIHGDNLRIGKHSHLPLEGGNYIEVAIQDKGIGIPEEYLQKIFDPYFTTKQKGSGLGLATAFSIANNHHGHISVESKLGEGTTFRVYLPASDQKIIQPPQENKKLFSGKGKILVMDDEAMVRHILDRMLLCLGYEAKFAKDGVEALELFIRAQQSGDTFTGVILDLTVPGGMGGKDTMARLLKIDPQVKAIVSSGYSNDPIMADFKKFGFAGVIAKPYKISDLGNVLNKVLTG